MPIDVAPATESLVQELIDSGRYHDADEVIRKAVALLADRDQEFEGFRTSVEESRDELRRGGGEYYYSDCQANSFISLMTIIFMRRVDNPFIRPITVATAILGGIEIAR